MELKPSESEILFPSEEILHMSEMLIKVAIPKSPYLLPQETELIKKICASLGYKTQEILWHYYDNQITLPEFSKADEKITNEILLIFDDNKSINETPNYQLFEKTHVFNLPPISKLLANEDIKRGVWKQLKPFTRN
jgi:hypothetical protein